MGWKNIFEQNELNLKTYCCIQSGKGEVISGNKVKTWGYNYMHQLRNTDVQNTGVYFDPDESYSSEDSEFYHELTNFLNIRENDLSDILCKKYSYEFSNTHPGGIIVKNNNDIELFRLRSDQFGFSAPLINRSGQHPYDIYLTQNKKISDDRSIENVCKWIIKSRTLGGSFLWPIEKSKDDRYKTEYNIARGGRIPGKKNYYIQDRVDLTLLEVKHTYEKSYRNQYSMDRLYAYYYKGNQLSAIGKWLSHFGDFTSYIKFFMLEDFVDSATTFPYNMLDKDNKVLLDHGRENEMIKEDTDIYNMVERLTQKIVKRSEKMMKYLESNSKM